MPTPLLGLTTPTQGSLTGAWGDVVNNEITTLLDSAVAGTTTLSTDVDVTLTDTQSATNQAREAILLWTAAGTVTRNITAPNRSKTYIVINASGTQSIVLRGTGPTTGITIVANEKCVAAWNGSDFVKVASSATAGGTVTSVTGTAPVVSSGGTTPVISMAAATSSVNGYLTSANWTTFNNKQGTITLTTVGTSGAATFNGTTLNIPQYSGGGGGGTVTSVGLSAPSIFTVTGSPVTGSGTLTLSYSGTALPVANGGTGVTSSTGSGGVVLAVSPTLVTPLLGTPTSGTLTNCTSIPVANATGQLPVANGGTGATATTGSGNNVLSTSPTITTPVISGNTTVNGLSLGTGSGSGGQNTVFGVSAGGSPTSSNNTAIGYSAAAGLGVGALNNTIVGSLALQSGNISSNSALGYGALNALSSGGGCTAIGTAALSASTNISNSSGLGASAAVTGSNQVQLGDSSTTTYVYGTVQNRSDIRDKADIRDTQLGLGFINALRPVDYKWDARDDYKPPMPEDLTDKEAMAAWCEACDLSNITHDGSKKRNRYHHGLIAQEVKAVLDAQGIDFGGYQDHKVQGGQDVMSIGYDELIAPLIKAIQELTARVKELEAKTA